MTALVTVFILVLKLKIRGQYLQPGSCTWQGVWVWIQCWPGITHPRFASLPADGSVNHFKCFFPGPSSSWKLALGSPLFASFLCDLICSCGFNLYHNADYSPIWVSIPVSLWGSGPHCQSHTESFHFIQYGINYGKTTVAGVWGGTPRLTSCQLVELPCGFLISPWGPRAGEGLALSSVCFQALLRLSSTNRWKTEPRKGQIVLEWSRKPVKETPYVLRCHCVKMFHKLSCWKWTRVRLK